MYCRICYYDLRGQIDPRCPECGTQFDPSDGSGTLPMLPIWYERPLRRLRRASVVLLMIVFVPAILVGIPSLTHCRHGPHSMIAQANLQHIVDTWRSLALSDPEAAALTPTDMASLFEVRVSPYQHRSYVSARHEKVLWVQNEFLMSVILLLVYSLLMLTVGRGILRRFAGFAAILAILLIYATFLAEPLSELWWRGDRSYLNDYVYVPVADWGVTSPQDQIIAAYDKQVLGVRRCIAFRNGLVYNLSDDEFRKLANEQGLNVESAADVE